MLVSHLPDTRGALPAPPDRPDAPPRGEGFAALVEEGAEDTGEAQQEATSRAEEPQETPLPSRRHGEPGMAGETTRQAERTGAGERGSIAPAPEEDRAGGQPTVAPAVRPGVEQGGMGGATSGATVMAVAAPGSEAAGPPHAAPAPALGATGAGAPPPAAGLPVMAAPVPDPQAGREGDGSPAHPEAFAVPERAPAGPGEGRAAPSAPSLPRQIAQQATAVITAAEAGRIELRLDPGELGRVTLQIVTEGDRVSLGIAAETRETTELIRRHLQELEQEFRALGYRSVDFSFEGGHGRGREARASRAEAKDAAPAIAPIPVFVPHHAPGPARAGLDLRL